MPRRSLEAGFTLVEVRVALAMSAVLLALLGDAVASAHQRQRIAGERERAVVLARRLIVESVSNENSQDDLSGASDDLRWQVRQSELAVAPNRSAALVEVRVEIENATGRKLVTVSARRLKSLVA